MNLTDEQVAIHESGHFVAASHYQIPAYPEITPEGISRLAPEISNAANAGVCHSAPPFTKFEYAVICWSGILAECLCGDAPYWAPPFRPSAKMLRDWHLMILNQYQKLSHGDQLGIFGNVDTGEAKKLRPGDVWRACKSAFKIIQRNRGRIRGLARTLVEARAKADREADESKWRGVPRPKTFPATHADFLKLICGNDAEKFEAFIVSRAALHLTCNDSASIEEAKGRFQTGFDDAYTTSMNLQRQIYAGDFADAESWLRAARDFQQWERSDTK